MKKKLEEYIRSVPDFPHEGIIFRDVTTVLQDGEGFRMAIDSLMEQARDLQFDVVVGTEARGFVFGAPLAYEFGKPFVLARKKGKLPFETITEEYELEYGTETLEMHKDSIRPGQKVILVDDLMATGGTLKAVARMVERLGGEVVAVICLMELKGLKGREKLADYEVRTVIAYEGK